MEFVKEIRITEAFANLRPDQRKCQTDEAFEECINDQLLSKMVKNCNCTPYQLSKFSSSNKVRKGVSKCLVYPI